MDNWLKSPWVIRIISLALAILLFTAVSLDESTNKSDAALDFLSSSAEAQKIEGMQVNIRIDQEKYVVSGVPQEVSVTLEGPNSLVTSTATQRSFDVYLDLENLETGTYTVPLQHSGISDSLNVYIEPKEVEVTIEEKATKDFNVTVDYINSNELADGYELRNPTVNPSTATITSSKSVIDKIAIVKAFVDVQGVDKPIEDYEAPIKVYDKQGNELSARVNPPTVDVSVDVVVPDKVVPIEVETSGELPNGITISSMNVQPTAVRIFAPQETLDQIDVIMTEPVDLANISGEVALDMNLVIPSGVRKIDEEAVSVEVAVERTIERTFEAIPIEVQNMDEDLTLTFLEPAERLVNVTVNGPESEVNNLSNNAIKPYINVENQQQGQYEIPIKIADLENITYEMDFERAKIRIE